MGHIIPTGVSEQGGLVVGTRVMAPGLEIEELNESRLPVLTAKWMG